MTRSLSKLTALITLSLLFTACPSEEPDTPGPPSPTAKDMGAKDLNTTPDQRQDQEDMAAKDMAKAPDLTQEDMAAKDLGPDLADMAPPQDMAKTPDMAPDMNMGLPGGPSSTRQRAVPKSMTQANRGFYEYLPPGYGDAKKRPLLVFFHGIGENGDGEGQLNKVLANGPPKLIKDNKWPEDRTFIVLSPQHPGGGCFGPDEIRDFLSFATANYDVDLNRVYLTGLSCGAIGLWNYLGKYTDDVVAAAVPIAGDGKGAYNRIDCELGLVPIWAFHGDQDRQVVPSGTNTPVDGLLDGHCPSPPRKEIKKTIYPGVGHNSWSRTYDLSAGHDIYAWLMSKRR